MAPLSTCLHKLLPTSAAIVALVFVVTNSLLAQSAQDVARQYIIANAAKQNLTVSDVSDLLVSSAYRSPTTGWDHVYFNQRYQSVEVYNRMLNVVVNNGQVTYLTHNALANLNALPVVGVLSTKLDPLVALQKAATHTGEAALDVPQIEEISTTKLPGGLLVQRTYKATAISNETVAVKLYWLAAEGDDKSAGKLILTWNVAFSTKDNQHRWNIHVDATSGAVLQQVDDVIHCNFGTPAHMQVPHACAGEARFFGEKQLPNKLFAPNTYNVFDLPLESPNHGNRSLVANPYTRFVPAGTGPGATNGWHTDGTTSFTITRGNNVWAQEDANANNGTGASPGSATLEFDHPYTFGLNTAAGNQNAAITNLFYWNNLIHDVLWKFGFDEPSGNFQSNNLGRGGAGNDFVFADAQDGNGTNNANFSTPVDGGNGRMQMYLWNPVSGYQPDGDFDNGIIAHEYGHGWSIRLTGGPANSSCLNHVEQGGEGWSDYLGLMLTTNWASLSANVASANIPRGIGTYALGQPITGAGIRPYRYSYDMTNVNAPVTYAQVGNTGFSQPHGIGSIWATMLWDMTWEMILQDGQIVANIYDTPTSLTAMRGNVAALKLVNEGLRLQPCSPSFVQARDAILQADQSIFGGRYRCAIARAFGRRGLGANASTGTSANDRLVSEQFTPVTGPFLSSALAFTICSGGVFAYTATSATAGVTLSWSRPAVSGISNASASAASGIISETLVNTTTNPITVTYLVTVGPDACGGVALPQRVRVQVNPLPTALVPAYVVCQNASVPAGEGLMSTTTLTTSTSGTLTTASPTYVRPAGDNVTSYTAGSTVYFRSYTFVAPANGSVTFAVSAASFGGGSDDSYLALYQFSFNPANPATNFVRGDDDSGPGLLSSLTQTLVGGRTYILVVSPFTNGLTGTFSLQSGIPVFPPMFLWYSVPSGGIALSTNTVFNPVGVAGSGVPNTATPGATTFYLASAASPVCRLATTFTVFTTAPPTAGVSATITAGNAATLNATGCTGIGDVLKWFRTADNVEVTMPVSPTATTQFYARCLRTSGSKSCLSDPSASVIVTVLPVVGTSFDSAMSGNWNVPGTWTCNCIPDGTKPVRIMGDHVITIPTAVAAQAQRLQVVDTGRVNLQGTGRINLSN